ncbi:hypothetical protein DY000_02059027 [Brassica cretica]|uniref:Uncharacterized protein n=1 Tax=Brassica cretica TaxID=69181 RepID=A0ABQ7B3V4_BRACR|nr:hypothetical protein DY000_02059027 [Brassica cretica]
MGAILPERRHKLALPYLSERPYQSDNTRSLAIYASERPYQSDNTRSLAIYASERPPRATRRSRSSSRATSPQRNPEVARIVSI